ARLLRAAALPGAASTAVGGPAGRTARPVGDDRRSAGPAGRYPAGLVLVDPSDVHAELYFSRTLRIQDAVQGPLLVGLARAGWLRPLLHAQARQLPQPFRSAAVDAVSTPTAARAMRAESAHVVRGLRALRLDPLDLD